MFYSLLFKKKKKDTVISVFFIFYILFAGSELLLAPQPLHSSCQLRLNGGCGQHTCSDSDQTTRG